MSPLSTPKYFLRNKRRVIPVLSIIVLAVIGICLIVVVGDSQFASYQNAWEKPYRYYALIESTGDRPDPAVIQSLHDRDDVERVLPTELGYLRFPSLLGSITVPMLALEGADFDWFIEHTDLQVAEGRLPGADQAEVILHQTHMRARGLAVGDVIGTAVDDRETLRGRWTIVGVVDGPVQVGLMPLNVYHSYQLPGLSAGQEIEASSYVVFPQPGQMESVDAFVRSLPRTQFSHSTFTSQQAILDAEYDSAKLVIWIIDSVSVSVLSVATGLLNTIYFMQRMPEYGTLAALGYSMRFLVRRTLTEAVALTCVAWAIGLIAAQLFTIAIRETLFTPRGYSLASLDPGVIYYTLPIPVLVLLFSTVTVVRQFRRLDPVTIVERRD